MKINCASNAGLIHPPQMSVQMLGIEEGTSRHSVGQEPSGSCVVSNNSSDCSSCSRQRTRCCDVGLLRYHMARVALWSTAADRCRSWVEATRIGHSTFHFACLFAILFASGVSCVASGSSLNLKNRTYATTLFYHSLVSVSLSIFLQQVYYDFHWRYLVDYSAPQRGTPTETIEKHTTKFTWREERRLEERFLRVDSSRDRDSGSNRADEGTDCAVCFDSFTAGETVRRLRCDHIYHAACIDHFLQLRNFCPICSAPVAPVSESNGCE